jgi:DNA-binding HxlR family transcriptional regulator
MESFAEAASAHRIDKEDRAEALALVIERGLLPILETLKDRAQRPNEIAIAMKDDTAHTLKQLRDLCAMGLVEVWTVEGHSIPHRLTLRGEHVVAELERQETNLMRARTPTPSPR